MGANGENPRKVLTSDKEPIAAVAWSPTGRRLAYIKRTAVGGGDFGGRIETVALEGGTSSVAFSDPELISAINEASLLWLGDGRLIFESRERPGSEYDENLWSIVVDPRTGRASGKASRLTSWHGVGVFATSVSRDGSRLVVWKTRNWNDVYVGELKESGTRLDPPRRLTVSDTRDLPNAWTPDSRTVLFESDRTGRRQNLQAAARRRHGRTSDAEAGGSKRRQGKSGWRLDSLLGNRRRGRLVAGIPPADAAAGFGWTSRTGPGSPCGTAHLLRLPLSRW